MNSCIMCPSVNGVDKPWQGKVGPQKTAKVHREDHDNKRIALYKIRTNQPAKLLNALSHGDVETNRSWISRSGKYFFLREPGPAIYSATNLSPIRAVMPTSNLTTFLRSDVGGREVLTDDLTYLIKPIWQYSDLHDIQYFDQISCYNFEKDSVQTITIHNGTNRTWILDSESAKGHLHFLAFWGVESPGTHVHPFTNLGVFDEQSALNAKVVLPPMEANDFSRNTVWDYAHAKLFLFDDPTLTDYDYGRNTVRRYTLDPGKLKAP